MEEIDKKKVKVKILRPKKKGEEERGKIKKEKVLTRGSHNKGPCT